MGVEQSLGEFVFFSTFFKPLLTFWIVEASINGFT
jgi:hypothetical protein